jgi:hypothetical protein
MPIIQNPSDLTKFVDLSDAVDVIKVRPTMTADLGLFTPRPLTTKTVMIPRIIENDFDIEDIQWGARAQNIGVDSKSYLTLPLPRFPVEDAIFPADLEGNYQWEDIVQGKIPETLTNTRTRKMAKISQNYMNLWERARMQLIVDGTAYAPNGTLAQTYGATVDFYQEFGVTREDFEMSLNDAAEDVLAENLNAGMVPGQFVAICGSTFFSKLVSHPYVKDAGKYINFAQSEDVLLGRLTASGLGLDNRYRAFSFGGIVWIENRAQMTATEARVFPADVPNMFVTFFAPSEMKFSTVNTLARPIYYFEKLVDDGQERFHVHAESNFLNACLYPQALVRVTIAA